MTTSMKISMEPPTEMFVKAVVQRMKRRWATSNNRPLVYGGGSNDPAYLCLPLRHCFFSTVQHLLFSLIRTMRLALADKARQVGVAEAEPCRSNQA